MINKINSKINISKSFLGIGILTLAILALVIPYSARAESLYRELQLGMSGADVGTLQTFLSKDQTIYPQGLVTNYFGSLTKSAVSNFQARNGIATVGRVGPITMAAINSQMNNGRVVGSDRYAPIISSLNINVSTTEATISWNTNQNASAIVYYNTTPITMIEASANSSVNISGLSLLAHTDLRTFHSATLTGLQRNTTYFYAVYVRDGSGNESVSTVYSFRTLD